jgi:hypothetical protein
MTLEHELWRVYKDEKHSRQKGVRKDDQGLLKLTSRRPATQREIAEAIGLRNDAGQGKLNPRSIGARARFV